MTTRERFLAAYDDQLRTDAETPSAVDVRHLGPLRLVTFARGRGFVTYRDFDGAGARDIRRLVGEALEHFSTNASIAKVEWKTRGHDRAPGLHEALIERGFVPEEPESIMIGPARLLARDVALPVGVALRKVETEEDVYRMAGAQAEVFGDHHPSPVAEALLRRLQRHDGMELWVAEAEGRIVATGRLEPVAATEFAGIWGGATRPEWRGKGIYRALTAVRAKSALTLGKALIHSDSTEYSRPILEKYGLLKVSTTTPYVWER